MRLLLDTHTLIWALEDSDQLSRAARELIVDLDNQILVSATSAIEIAIKRSMRRLEAPDDLLSAIEGAGFVPITIDFATAERLATLPFHHRDPFDRLLVAQCLSEGVPIITRDPAFEAYPVTTLW